MKKKFSELEIFKQLNNKHADAACIVSLEEYEVTTMSFDLCVSKIGSCLVKEFDRVSIGSCLRIMVLTEEREVRND
jgi:hypothetical protein